MMGNSKNFGIYIVYEDEREVFRGTCDEVAEHLKVVKSTVYHWCQHGKLLFDKYLIVKSGNKVNSVVKETEQDKYLKHMIYQLNKHGNTIVSRKLDWYLDKLSEYGIKYKVREVIDSSPENKRKKERYYVIEVADE